MVAKTPDYTALIHTPAQAAQEHVAWAECIKATPGIQFGVPAIDRRVIPIRPGEEVAVIARPGHCKTSLLAYFAREQARRIAEAGNSSREAIVYVTWEQSAEELDAFFQADGKYSITDIAWGRVDLELVKQRAVKRAILPIWIIGHGIGRAGQEAPRMTVDVVLGAIRTMEQNFNGVRPALLLFDYMQLIPVARARDRVQQVTEVPHLVKELALSVGAPAIVGVQASRDVDERRVKLPEMRDAQWASSIEQTCDKVFSLWRPILTEPPGSPPIELDGKQYPITEQLLFIQMLKQRGDRGRYLWGMHFKPEYLQLNELEMRHADPRF
jgi:replicative DNA helicase